jgi:hypothetical protein
LTPPLSSLESDLNRMVRAMSMTSSRVIDLLCLIFFSFLRSRGGSFRALMTSDEAEGTTETAACRFWMVSLTVTRRPFYEAQYCLDFQPRGHVRIRCLPSHPSPSQYLLRPSSVTGQGDQS